MNADRAKALENPDDLPEAPLWGQRMYLDLGDEVDPYRRPELFRSRQLGFAGDTSFWRTPSPEPATVAALSDPLLAAIRRHTLSDAIAALATALASYTPPDEIVLVAILRAGVPIVDWLARLLPGSRAVTLSLFVGVGIDQRALQAIRRDFPTRKLVFVDGWTGKGGVAGEIRKLDAGPLAVLIDPWQLADFRGTTRDVMCPSALFTGPTTLGFSRTFIRQPDQFFRAYRFPSKYLQPEWVASWQAACPSLPARMRQPAFGVLPAAAFSPAPFHSAANMRFHSNEVCRALINSNPGQLLFAGSLDHAREHYELLLELADRQRIPQRFEQRYLTKYQAQVACTLELKSE